MPCDCLPPQNCACTLHLVKRFLMSGFTLVHVLYIALCRYICNIPSRRCERASTHANLCRELGSGGFSDLVEVLGDGGRGEGIGGLCSVFPCAAHIREKKVPSCRAAVAVKVHPSLLRYSPREITLCTYHYHEPVLVKFS